MRSVIDRLKPYAKFAQTAWIVLAIIATGLFSYRYGYSQGSGEILVPPTHVSILNPTTSGEFSLIPEDSGATVDFGSFWKIWNILDKNFVPSSTTTASTTAAQARVAGAIDGLVRSYGDPYTLFIPKEQSVAFKEQVNGEFEGIGAVLNVVDGTVLVVGLLKESPAEKAGLKPGDRIIAVDNDPTVGKKLEDVIPHIRGPKGTTVTLTVSAASSTKESTIAITRGTVVIPTTATRVVSAAKTVVENIVAKTVAAAQAAAASLPGTAHEQKIAEAKAQAAQIAKQKFFVLILATFAKSSIDSFVKDLSEFSTSDTQNLIIDLRNNPGGYLDTAVDLASYFLPKDTLIVSERTGAQSIMNEHRSSGHELLQHSSQKRIVVLLNRNSASASEILAGALQDNKVAKVVGETSFGKGSVQTLVDIGDLGSLKITIARWYTPSGKNISHTGISPDIAVNPEDPKYASSTDPFMDAAVETLLDDSLWK